MSHSLYIFPYAFLTCLRAMSRFPSHSYLFPRFPFPSISLLSSTPPRIDVRSESAKRGKEGKERQIGDKRNEEPHGPVSEMSTPASLYQSDHRDSCSGGAVRRKLPEDVADAATQKRVFSTRAACAVSMLSSGYNCRSSSRWRRVRPSARCGKAYASGGRSLRDGGNPAGTPNTGWKAQHRTNSGRSDGG